MANVNGLVLERLSATKIRVGVGQCQADDGGGVISVTTPVDGGLVSPKPNEVYAVWLKQTATSLDVIIDTGIPAAARSQTNERWRRIGRIFTDAAGAIVPFLATGSSNDRKYQYGGDYKARILSDSNATTWTPVQGGKWLKGGNANLYVQVSSTGDNSLVRTEGSATADVLVVGSTIFGISIGTSADILEFKHSGTSGSTTVVLVGLEETI